MLGHLFARSADRGQRPSTESASTPHEKPTGPQAPNDLETQDLEAQDHADGWTDPYGPPPGFKGWLVLYWHDLLAFVFLAALSLWLLVWSPVPYHKYFAVAPATSNTINTDYGYPKRRQHIPIIADAMLAVFAPIVSIVAVNLFGIGTYYPPGGSTARPHRLVPSARRRGTFLLGRGSFWNVSNGCMGVIYSVMTGAAIQIIVKLAVPGMRPHFLTVCDPQLGPNTPGQGFRGLYFDTSVCRDHDDAKRRDEIANALQSFPSGHSVAAWAGLLYLSLYLNGHLKIFSNYHPSYWKLLLFVAPLVAATLIVGSLSLDMSHNWYDIVAGSLLGCTMAILSYRMCFASVWDFRWNHVPLLRGARSGEAVEHGFGYSLDEMRQWSGGCATRRAGWGVAHGVFCGAPGDSTALFAAGHPVGGGPMSEDRVHGRHHMGAAGPSGAGY